MATAESRRVVKTLGGYTRFSHRQPRAGAWSRRSAATRGLRARGLSSGAPPPRRPLPRGQRSQSRPPHHQPLRSETYCAPMAEIRTCGKVIEWVGTSQGAYHARKPHAHARAIPYQSDRMCARCVHAMHARDHIPERNLQLDRLRLCHLPGADDGLWRFGRTAPAVGHLAGHRITCHDLLLDRVHHQRAKVAETRGAHAV